MPRGRRSRRSWARSKARTRNYSWWPRSRISSWFSRRPPGLDPAVLELQRRMGFEVVAQRLDGVEDITAVVRALSGLAASSPVAVHRERAWMQQPEFIQAARSSVAAESSSVDDPAKVDLVMLHSVDPFGLVGREDVSRRGDGRRPGGRNLVRRPGWIDAGVEELDFSRAAGGGARAWRASDDGRRLGDAAIASVEERRRASRRCSLARMPSSRVLAHFSEVVDRSARTPRWVLRQGLTAAGGVAVTAIRLGDRAVEVSWAWRCSAVVVDRSLDLLDRPVHRR